MLANKVKLQVEHNPEYDPHESHMLPLITHSLPFYKSDQSGKYFHRVRSANNHALFKKYSHTSVRFWCGNSGFISNGKGRLYQKIPDGGVLCAVCEGKAIGAGEDGSRLINGRSVMYSPRK